MAKADLDADAAKAIFARTSAVGAVGLSGHVSHKGSYVKETLFSVKKNLNRRLGRENDLVDRRSME